MSLYPLESKSESDSEFTPIWDPNQGKVLRRKPHGNESQIEMQFERQAECGMANYSESVSELNSKIESKVELLMQPSSGSASEYDKEPRAELE